MHCSWSAPSGYRQNGRGDVDGPDITRDAAEFSEADDVSGGGRRQRRGNR
ncbi:hypothetical protein CSC27_7062, partial [Pseudomonas aeruginosa]